MTALLAGCAATAPQVGVGGAKPALPWGGGELRVGYIRSDVITDKYPDYRDADVELRRQNEEWLRDAEKMEEEIARKSDELEELRLILGDEQRQRLEDELVEARRELQRFRQETWYDENSTYLAKRRELMEPIDARVNDAIWKVAEEMNLDIVFDTIAGNIVYSKPAYDITDRVLEELNR